MVRTVAILVLGLAAPAAGQTDSPSTTGDGAHWVLPDALGYGGLGFGVGLAMAWDMESDGFGPPAGARCSAGR